MNTRTFLASLLVVVAAPWKAITQTRKGYTPLLEQVFPKTPEELPGLYCHYIYGQQVFPYEIIREFDHFNDQWEGQSLDNSRRNKWWAKGVDGKTVLFNDEYTLFFRKL